MYDYIQSALEKGWIRPSKSPIGMPILFIPKPDSILYLCVDYRGLNAFTVKNRYLLLLISKTIDHLTGVKVYS